MLDLGFQALGLGFKGFGLGIFFQTAIELTNLEYPTRKQAFWGERFQTARTAGRTKAQPRTT